LQNISQSTQTTNALTNKVKQISEAEAPNLSFSAGADSETFTKLINNLATAIRNTISTTCSQDNTNTNIFNCSDFAVFEGESEQEIFGNYLLKCVQNVSSVTTAKQDLQNFIDQHSTAKVEDVIFKILMAVAAIMLIYFLGPALGKLLGGGSSSTETPEERSLKKKNTAIIVLFLILITIILLYFFVFKKK
jgi:ABC-type cobalt transport system substrate-binding protein